MKIWTVSIAKSFLDWLYDNADFNIAEHGQVIAELIQGNFDTKKKVNDSAATDEPLTVEYFQVMAKECGISFEEMENMSVGNVLDVVYTYIDLHDPNKKHVRNATQADIDRF